MKISKHIHSCLLVEENGIVVLIDPGSYTFDEKALDLTKINRLDYLLITHEHFDHMHIPLVKEIVAKFPQVKIISNPSVKDILGKEGITVSVEDNEVVTHQQVPHEKVWGFPPPQNYQFTIFGKLTTPGDSHSFTQTAEILALPITAPWGSTTRAVEIAESLKPKVIIPIHDWHWRDEARKAFYQRLTEYFQTKGIDFRGLETGVITTV